MTEMTEIAVPTTPPRADTALDAPLPQRKTA